MAINLSFCQTDTQMDTSSNFPLYPNSTNEYRVTGFNTNFVIPTVRVNFHNDIDNSTGRVSAFNSIGAGFSFGGGRLIVSTDSTNRVISKKFKNTFSIQTGFLFSISNNTPDGSSNSIFAPVIGINFLNFNLSTGIELGERSVNQKKGFVTLSYNLPISAILPNTYWIWAKNKKPIKYSLDKD